MYVKLSCIRNSSCFHLQVETDCHGACLIYNSYWREFFSSPSLSGARNFGTRSPPPPSSRQHTSISITAHHLSYMHIIDQFFELSLLCIRRDAAEYTYTGSYRDARSTKHTIIVAFISNFIKLNRLYTT